MFLEWENNNGKLQIISGKFQNNAINDVKQISLNHMINYGIRGRWYLKTSAVSGHKFLRLVGKAKDKNKNKNIRAESDISVSLILARAYN